MKAAVKPGPLTMAGAGRRAPTRRQVLALGGAALGGCALPSARPDRPLQGPLEALIQPLVQAGLFSGAVVLVCAGQVLAAGGWGLAVRGPDLAFTPRTPCDAASLAKNFTAAGILQLIHAGQLQWQQPVQALVPAYPHAGVTVHHLLSHSSGLAPDYTQFDRHFRPGERRTTQALLQLAGGDQPVPLFTPGSRFLYSDLALDAAALVIERVSGQPFADFVRQRFWQAHGLADAFARPAFFADWPGPRTRGYRLREGCWTLDDAYDGEAFVGASNLIFSALDLARWGDAWAHARVLPAAADRAGSAFPVLGGESSPFNLLGWQGTADGLQGGNTGEYNGFHARVHWQRPRREALAFVSNSGLPAPAAQWLQQALIDLLAGRPVPPGPDLPPAPAAPQACRGHAAAARAGQRRSLTAA